MRINFRSREDRGDPLYILYVMTNDREILVVDNLDDVLHNLDLMKGYTIYGWVNDVEYLRKMIKEAEINDRGAYYGWDELC